MSEYQYYEFLAIDEALDARQMRELRALSTRARITPTGFVNTYHWGDFKGDPRVLMERYFDAFLYLANWGNRLIMIRLPSSLLDLETAGRYCRGDSAWAWQAGDKIVVGLTQEGADGYWDEDDGTSLGLTVPARAELAAGDRRLLYLAWLLSVGAGEVADDELEPAVPAGLASLSPSLRAVFEFLHVDGDLLAAAAEASEPLGAIEPSGSELSRWVTNLSVKEKDVLLTRLLGRDAPNVRLELSRRVREDAHARPDADGTRSVGELREAAARIRERREQLAAKRKAEEKARAARAHAAARERHLSALALRQEQAWQRVRAAIDTRQPGQYDAAVELLGDLRAVGEREGRLAAFEHQLQDLRRQHSKKPSLLRRLDRAGLGPVTEGPSAGIRR